LKESWPEPVRAFFEAVPQVIDAGTLPLLVVAVLCVALVLVVIGIAIVTGADEAQIEVPGGLKVKLHWPRSRPP
jgi:hypothetical protein